VKKEPEERKNLIPMARRVEYSFDAFDVFNQPNKPTYTSDFFRFDVSIVIRNCSNPPNSLRTVSSMLETPIYINCNQFFNHNQIFQLFCLSQLSSPYLTHWNLAELSENLIPTVKEIFNISGPFVTLPRPTSNFHRGIIFPVVLHICVDVYPDEERSRTDEEMIEESMQFVNTTPASNEAISSLKACSLPRDCCICMQRFHDELEEGGSDDSDDVKVSTMACGHIFHHDCIVKWLQTSHVCPLCRYAMPT